MEALGLNAVIVAPNKGTLGAVLTVKLPLLTVCIMVPGENAPVTLATWVPVVVTSIPATKPVVGVAFIVVPEPDAWVILIEKSGILTITESEKLDTTLPLSTLLPCVKLTVGLPSPTSSTKPELPR